MTDWQEVKMPWWEAVGYCFLMWFLWARRLHTGSWHGKKD